MDSPADPSAPEKPVPIENPDPFAKYALPGVLLTNRRYAKGHQALVIDPTDPDLPQHPQTARQGTLRDRRRKVRELIRSEGGKLDLRHRGHKLVVKDPEGIKEYLLIEGGKLWCDRVLDGVKVRDRTCMRLYGETVKLVGGQQNVVNILVQQLGVRDEAELQKLVNLGRKFQTIKNDASLSLEQYRDEAIELLKMLLKEKPEWKHIVAYQLGVGEAKA